MAREVIVTHTFIEHLAFRLVAVEREGGDWLSYLLQMGAEAALCKVQATRTFEHCARDAAHLQGGKGKGDTGVNKERKKRKGRQEG